MNIKDSMGDSFLRVVFNEAINQGYSLQDVMKIFEEVNREKELVCFGKHGSCKWSLDNKGTLTIEPRNGKQGALAGQDILDYVSPWEGYENDIKKVVVKDGVSAAVDSSFLFAELHKCKEMDLSKLDTSKVKDMDSIFLNCFNLEMINLDGWDVSNVKNMSQMFSNCESLELLDISSFDMKGVENSSRMFKGCRNLECLKISEKGFILDGAFKPFMFESCDRLKIDNGRLESLLIKSDKPFRPVVAWIPPKELDGKENKKEGKDFIR